MDRRPWPPAAFCSLDREGRFSHVDAAAERLLGHSRDELLGAVIRDAYPAALDSAFEDSYGRAVASGHRRGPPGRPGDRPCWPRPR